MPPLEDAGASLDPTELKFFTPRTRIWPRSVALLSALVLLTLIAVACGGNQSEVELFDPQSSTLGMIEISSPAFGDGDSIPVKFTCDGDDSSPPLRWSEPPAGTRALVIVVDDPDAPRRIFRHWSVYNIPSGTRSIKESRPTTPRLENTTLQGENDFGRVGYGGPCPPRGQEHEYMFFIYALTEPLELEPGASPAEVTAAIRGRVLGVGSFSGMYARR